MLQIDTYIKDTGDGRGFGVYTKEDIPKDTLIWKKSLLDKVISDGDFRDYNEREKEFIYKYGFQDGIFWVLCIDNAKYINHSLVPNTYIKDDCVYALVDIKKDEEMLENYLDYCEYRQKHGLEF